MRSALLSFIFAFSLFACHSVGEKASERVEVQSSSSSEKAEIPTGGSVDSLPPSTPVSRSSALAPNGNELELKLAKLWARVDELENQTIQQKERMKLIEKGLLLGIIPEELKTGKIKKKAPAVSAEDAHETHEETSEDSSAASAKTPAPLTKVTPEEKSNDLVAYKRLLQKAQDKFNAANYGQAIVHFNEIGDRFDDSVTEGSHLYWIGLSWYYLKEYQIAEQSLKTLREKHPENPWVSHARYYQAKIDQTRGLSKRALEQFTQLMEEFASQDLGEMARMEVARMREKL